MQATKKAQICFWIEAELDKQRHATATDECSCYARTLRYKSRHILCGDLGYFWTRGPRWFDVPYGHVVSVQRPKIFGNMHIEWSMYPGC